MVLERSGRIPYHNPLFHISGPYRQGQNQPPLLIRRPSNHSLVDLLPEPIRDHYNAVPPQHIWVDNQVNHGADIAGAGANAPGGVVHAGVRPFMPPNPVAIEHREQQLRQEFEAYTANLVARIHRDQQNRNRPFNMVSNHAVQGNNMRAARRQRREQNDQAVLEHPPAAQPDEDHPPNLGQAVVAGEPANNQIVDAPPAEQPEDDDMDI